MSWKCPECGELNYNSISKCTCGSMLSENEVSKEQTKNASPPVENVKDAASFAARSHPWLRFWARTFDLTLFSLLIGFIVFYSTGHFVGNAIAQVTISNLSLVCFFFAFIVEAILIAWIGTTPGKYLLEINVRKTNHSLLSFPLSLKRSISIWGAGYAFGLPIISFFTVAYAGNNIQKYGKASWDVADNIMVMHKPLNQVKKYIFIVLFLGILSVLAILNQYSEAQTYMSTQVNENIQTAISSQDAEGMTQQNMNIDFLKNLENYIRKQTEIKAQAFLDANGMHKKKVVVKAEGVYIETGGQKLAVIRVSDQFDMSRGVVVHGIKGNQFKRVMCTRATNEPIPISYGPCADKIKEAFGVTLIQ